MPTHARFCLSSPSLRLALLISLSVALPAAPCLACYSGLMLIPTAEVVGRDAYCVDLQLEGTFSPTTADTRIVNTQVGLSDRLEAGVDFDLSRDAEARLLLNAKYLLVEGGDSSPAVAVGFCSVGHHSKPLPYAVATQEFGAWRGHLGGWRTEGHDRLLLGADWSPNDRWMFMADYSNGDENSASLGVSYSFNEQHNLSAGLVIPNAAGESTGFVIHWAIYGGF